jgi:hypothetical protein
MAHEPAHLVTRLGSDSEQCVRHSNRTVWKGYEHAQYGRHSMPSHILVLLFETFLTRRVGNKRTDKRNGSLLGAKFVISYLIPLDISVHYKQEGRRFETRTGH